MSEPASPHGPYPTSAFQPARSSGTGRHKLLQRQLRRCFGEAAPEACGPLLDVVDAAYRQFDDERALLERSLELTSEELIERNERLRAELTERIEAQEALQHELAQRKQVEEALRRYVVRLDQAQRIARLGYWEWDARLGVTGCSDEALRLLGYEPGAVVPTLERLYAHVHPDDDSALAEALLVAGNGAPCDFEFRVTRADGALRTIRASVSVLAGEAGLPLHAFGVCVDVTEQKRYEQALVQAKEQAEEARRHAEEMLRLKSAFLNNMSHELRTPLTGIIGFAEVLAEEVGTEHGEIVSIITTSARRLMDTLNSVLDLAQIESGTVTLVVRPLAVAAEVGDALALLRSLAEGKGLTLEADLDPTAYALADATALNRVLNNLVGNAVKFTERGGVTVRVQRDVGPGGDGAPADPDGICLLVSDTGPGISAEFLPHLFEEFKQASTGYARSHEGNGLGLAITKRLVDLMGGRIEVESTLGRGTTFTVRLPPANQEETRPPWHEAEAGAVSAVICGSPST